MCQIQGGVYDNFTTAVTLPAAYMANPREMDISNHLACAVNRAIAVVYHPPR